MKQHLVMPAGLLALSILATPAMAQTAPATADQPATSQAAPAAPDQPTVTPPADSPDATLVEMKTSKPLKRTPAASPSVTVASPSVTVASPSVTVASPSVGPQAAAPEESAWTMPKLPFGVSANVVFDGLGSGTVNNGTYVSVPASANGQTTNVPGVGTASPSVNVGGYSVGVEADLTALSLGARYQHFGMPANDVVALVTPTPPGATTTTFNVIPYFPADSWDLYGRLGALKVGYRNEGYLNGANFGTGSNYGDLIAGLNFGFGVMDVVSLNFGALGGYALSKPTGLTVPHIPFEGDIDLMVKLWSVRGRLGYKAVGAADADLGTLMTAFTSPSSLATDANAQANLSQTRFGLYRGPYLSLEIGF